MLYYRLLTLILFDSETLSVNIGTFMLYYRLLTLILFDSETLSVNIGTFGGNKYSLLSSTDTDII